MTLDILFSSLTNKAAFKPSTENEALKIDQSFR